MTTRAAPGRRAWARIPAPVRKKIWTSAAFRRVSLGPEDGVGWGLFLYLRPEAVARMVAHYHDHPAARIFILVPSVTAMRSAVKQPQLLRMLRRVPWWQRVGLAAGLRLVHVVVPVRALDEQAWVRHIRPAKWLGCLEDWGTPIT